MSIKLSVLIPSIPARIEAAGRLFAKLHNQVKGRDVEILMLLDNKKRTIGKKREALVNISRGDYVAFVDDDDRVSDDYIVSILQGIEENPDVVTFKQNVIISGMEGIVDFDLMHKENEPFKQNATTKRMPFHVCAFRGTIARKHGYPDIMYGEDWEWCKKLLKETRTQAKINKVIHTYIFDEEITEAK